MNRLHRQATCCHLSLQILPVSHVAVLSVCLIGFLIFCFCFDQQNLPSGKCDKALIAHLLEKLKIFFKGEAEEARREALIHQSRRCSQHVLVNDNTLRLIILHFHHHPLHCVQTMQGALSLSDFFAYIMKGFDAFCLHQICRLQYLYLTQ